MKRRGYSLIGILITLALMLVLYAIAMSALSKRMTGSGATLGGTVSSMRDQLHLTGMMQVMQIDAMDRDGRLLTPADVSGSEDPSENTTANFFSAMVMKNSMPPTQLISANEYSGYVVECTDYDYRAYAPNAGVYWDPRFEADLSSLSHVSFAHMPLFGDRFRRGWRSSAPAAAVLFGNRGPRDGVVTDDTYTCGEDRVWRGHLVFGDGHVAFVDTMEPHRAAHEGPDNIFIAEDGADGSDAFITFTRAFGPDGATFQWD